VVAMLLPWISWYFPREWRFHALAPGPGILILPAGALILFLAAEARKRYRWQLLALCVLAVQLPALSGEARPILEETGEHAFIEPERHQVLDYLEQHYDGSRILIDMSKLAPLAYDSQLALKNFVYNEGTGAYWHRTMRAPEAEVGWLCAETGDEVWRWLRDEPEKAARYSLVLRTEHFLLYRRKAGAGDPPDGQHP